MVRTVRKLASLRRKTFNRPKLRQGFFVYNYGAAGIHRRADWMVTLKGFNTNVWGFGDLYEKTTRYLDATKATVPFR